MDALLASPSSKVWHRYHSKWGMEHRQSLKSSPDKHVVELERTGAIPKLRDKLYYAAHQYKRCKPLNPSSTKLGWYDEVVDEQDDGLDCASDSYEVRLSSHSTVNR